MFFSKARRPDVNQHPAVFGDTVSTAKALAVAGAELVELDTGWDDACRHPDPIGFEDLQHGLGRDHQGVHVVALGGRETPGGQPQPCRGDDGDVLVQVLFEEGMIRLDHRHPEPPRQGRPCIVGHEGGMDVQQVEATGRQPDSVGLEAAGAQDAVLRVQREITRGDSQDLEGLRRAERP